MTELTGLAEAVALCQEDRVKQLVEEKIAAGTPPTEIVTECNRGMTALGDRFASEDCFLPDLMFGGMIMKAVMARLAPLMEAGEGPAAEAKATAVMGTVRHDVHDIGKDIVTMLLRGVGFEVVDLGVDVPPEKFVEAIREHKPQVVGLSVLLTTCYKSVTETVEAIRASGLREGLHIMVGGAAAGELLSQRAGCDFYGRTAVDGLKFACQAAGVE